MSGKRCMRKWYKKKEEGKGRERRRYLPRSRVLQLAVSRQRHSP
jgi:hypothetical protein